MCKMPKKSCVVVIRECSRKGIVKESVAVYDENENVFFKNGKRISKAKNGDTDNGSNYSRNCILLDWMCNGRFY